MTIARSTTRRLIAEHLHRQQDGQCSICREPIDLVDAFHLDHHVPLSRGGGDSLDNLRLAHARCNRMKYDGTWPRVIQPKPPRVAHVIDASDDDPLMTLNEAADYAKVTPGALRIAAREGTLTAQKVGRDWIVTRKAVDDYLATRRGGVGRKPYGKASEESDA